MRQSLIIFFIGLSSFLYGQNKYDYIYFNKLLEMEGTEFVIAMIENRGKVAGVKEKCLLFINTENGEVRQVDFNAEAYIGELKQIRIDSLGIT